MEFVHQPYQPNETIAAIATPLGEGGVAIIRISGKKALQVASKIFSGNVCSYKTHTAHFGHVINNQGEHVDDALVIPFLGSRSFTGEDTVEIHCHGGSLITRRVLDVVIEAGARQARPGEFSFRAFINGKVDLAQAEAIQELVSAKNEKALDAAEQQLQGALSTKVIQFQHELTEIAAILEAWVDFPEEGLEFASIDQICQKLQTTIDKLNHLIDTYHDGKIIHDGIALCLVGSPNVGKSSIMNLLLDKERAIVSHQPGTTRDIVEDHLRLNGLNFRLIDTAGIRETSESIEQEGIRRSKKAMEEADLILWVVDSQEENSFTEEMPKEKTILIWNKIDLPLQKAIPQNFPHVVAMSAKEGKGIKELHEMIDQVVWSKGPPSKEEILVTNVRHYESLKEAAEACQALITGLRQELSPELLTQDMRSCLRALGTIIGTNISEDILSSIFSKFCIGK